MNGPTPIAIAVVEHADRVLVGRRPPGVALAGLWEFPGGKVEADEPPATAAVRECWEETGITVVVDGEFPSHVHTYDHGRVRLHFFRCRLADANQPPPREPFRWVERSELERLEFPDGNRGLLTFLRGASPNESKETTNEQPKEEIRHLL